MSSSFFSFFLNLPIFKPHNLFIFYFLNNLKCYRSTTWSSTNHLVILISTEQHTSKFLGVYELTFVCSMICFFEFWPPLIWGAVTFSFVICFQWLLLCQMCQEEEFTFCLDTKNKRAFPLDSTCPEQLIIQSLYHNTFSNGFSIHSSAE
jgi:hypothetical protein